MVPRGKIVVILFCLKMNENVENNFCMEEKKGIAFNFVLSSDRHVNKGFYGQRFLDAKYFLWCYDSITV